MSEAETLDNRYVEFTGNQTIENVNFIPYITQRIKLDALRLSSAVADELGNIPVYEATLIGYFRTFFSLSAVNGEEVADLIKRVRTSKDPRKEILKVIEEKKWDRDWESVNDAHRAVFKDDSPETDENKENFHIGGTGSSTRSESQQESES